MTRRMSSTEPGFDCGPGGRDCLHDPKGNHGCSGGRWRYAVIDGDSAVSLTVLAHDYPPTVDRSRLPESLRRPLPEALCFHEACEDGEPCDLVPGGKCRGDCSYLHSGEFWDEHHVGDEFVQPESFWLALESRLPE